MGVIVKMEYGESLISILKYSFSGLRRGDVWKFFPLLVIGYFLINIINPASVVRNAVTVPSLASMPLVAVYGLLVLVGLILVVYFSYKLLYQELVQIRGSVKREDNISTLVGYVATSILQSFAAVFSVFDLRILVLGILTAAFALGAYFTRNLWVFVPLAALFGVAYLIGVIRNSMRLLPAYCLYLEGASITESISQAWNATPRKALKIFGMLLVLSVVMMVLTLVFLVPQLLANFVDVLIAVAIPSVPIMPLSAVVNGAFSAIQVMIGTLFAVGVYNWLIPKNAPAPVQVTPAPRAPTSKPVVSKPVAKPVSSRAKVAARKK